MDAIAYFDNMDDTKTSVPYANFYKIDEKYIKKEENEETT